MSTEMILTLVGIVLGSNWLGNILLEVYKNKKKKKSPLEKMVLSLGRDKLLCLSKQYIRNGYIPEDEFYTFDKLGEAYIDLGGNSLVKKKYEEAKALPVKEEEHE